MTEDLKSESAQNEQEIIDAYKRSLTELDKIKRNVPLTLLLILTLNALFIIVATRSFFVTDLDLFSKQFSANLAVVFERHSPQIRKAASELLPVYTAAFQKVAHEELPSLRRAIVEEMNAVENFGKERLPTFHEEINGLIEARANEFVGHVEKAIGRPVTKEELHALLESYRREMVKRADLMYTVSAGEHRTVVTKIAENLDALAKREPDLGAGVGPEHATGVLLEFLGIELQSGSLVSPERGLERR